jgi:toluene monooxygenase system ferredoxin subunit
MTWSFICDAADVPANTIKKFVIGGIRLVVANYDGRFRVLPPICPHMEEPLEESGVIANCVLTCTKHLWAWNLDSLEMQGETERPLQSYETRQDRERVMARIDKEIVYEFDSESDEDDDQFFSR